MWSACREVFDDHLPGPDVLQHPRRQLVNGMRLWVRRSSGSERVCLVLVTVTVTRCSKHWPIRGGGLRLPGGWWGEAVGDRGCLEPVRRPELAQDVRDVDAGGLDADH